MRYFFLLLVGIASFSIIAQPASKRISRSEYIELYKKEAIQEMHRSGVPASITLAQGILESGDGNSPLARYAKNHFGIKCHSDWKGKTFVQDDDARDECFRKYNDVLESYRDHSEFLKKNRYAFLFDLKTTDYKGWAKGLKKAGYATNPKYPQLLIDIIEKNDLAKYDQMNAEDTHDDVGKKLWKAKSNSVSSNSRKKGSHQIRKHENNIQYIEVKPEDSFDQIAAEFDMGLWQLYKYNDWDKDEPLFEEGMLFLQPKRNRAQEEYHYVGSGESMWDISQQHGIKLKKLYKKNRMEKGEEPSVGQKLYLRKRVRSR